MWHRRERKGREREESRKKGGGLLSAVAKVMTDRLVGDALEKSASSDGGGALHTLLRHMRATQTNGKVHRGREPEDSAPKGVSPSHAEV